MNSFSRRAVESSRDYAERCRIERQATEEQIKAEAAISDLSQQQAAKAAAQRARADYLEKVQDWRDTVAQLDKGRNYHRKPECAALIAAMKNQETAESDRHTGMAALPLSPDVYLTQVGLRAKDHSRFPGDRADETTRLTALSPSQAASLDLDELSIAVRRHLAEYAKHGHTDALCDARDADAELTLDKRAARSIRLATIGTALLMPALGFASGNVGLLLGAAPMAGVGALLGAMIGFGPTPPPLFPEKPHKPPAP